MIKRLENIFTDTPQILSLAVIGTAGRGGDILNLNIDIYQKMIDVVKYVIDVKGITHLVSGGAAWADNVCLEIDLPKTIYLPADEMCVKTAEYYSELFHTRVPMAKRLDDVDNIQIFRSGTFKDRNRQVAVHADTFIAMTFGTNHIVKDGGTRHTVDLMIKQGKQGMHFNLNDCKLYEPAE